METMSTKVAGGDAPEGIMEGVPAGSRRWVARLDAVVGSLVEVPATILVLAEIVVLFAGVVGRYVSSPLIWTDELSSILFLWLAMLGSVVAFRRGEHMRMTALVGK